MTETFSNETKRTPVCNTFCVRFNANTKWRYDENLIILVKTLWLRVNEDATTTKSFLLRIECMAWAIFKTRAIFQLRVWSFGQINPFVPNAPFVYPLKTSENCKVFWCFQGVKKGCIGNVWVSKETTSNFRGVVRTLSNI